jgi:hypothetical protein
MGRRESEERATGNEQEGPFVRSIGGGLAATGIAALMTVLIGVEQCVREEISPTRLGAPYMWLTEWFGLVALWGIFGGLCGIPAGFLAPRRLRFVVGMMAGAVPWALAWLLSKPDPWKGMTYEPHPPGVLHHLLWILLPTLSGGVAACIVSGGPRGKA